MRTVENFGRFVSWLALENFLLPGNNSCSRLKLCRHICFAEPTGYTCACPDNMRTVTSSSGMITCECSAGEYMADNGECKTHSEYT